MLSGMETTAAGPGDFDFFIGRWAARVRLRDETADRFTGVWQADFIAGGAILLDSLTIENHEGETVRSMATLRTWVPHEHTWIMTFLYAGEPQPPVALSGHRTGDAIELRAHDLASDRIAHVRFFEISESSFRWEQRSGGRLDVGIECQRIAWAKAPHGCEPGSSSTIRLRRDPPIG